MKYFVYKKFRDYDDISHPEYLHVNNFGLFENLDYNVGVNRQFGREDYQLLIMLEGIGTFNIDSKKVILKKNHCILYHPHEPQIYSILAGNSYLWIHFTGTEIEPMLKRLDLMGKYFYVEDISSMKKILSKMLEYTSYDEKILNEMLNAQLILMLSNLCKKSSQCDPGILKVISAMKLENFKSCSTKEYAEIAGVSQNHFIRKFRKYTKMTPHQYKAKLIIEKACELLSDYTLNISEISSILGFDDSLYFSRFFKKNTGMSPSEYKKYNTPQ